MLQYLDPVPFTIDNDSHFGLSETQGLLGCDGAHLVIEYRIADTVIGALKTASTALMLPLGELHSIRYQSRYFGFVHSITLRTRNQRLLERLPESKMGMVTMKVRRQDREIAEAFCMGIREAIARHTGRMLEDELARLEGREGGGRLE